MLQKKVCLLGAFAVGKTSLVSRYVRSVFSEKYHTTVGVKVDQKQLVVNEIDVRLLLWDLAGEDEFNQIQPQYLRGAAGYVLVVDGTRQATLDTARSLHQRAVAAVGEVPFTLLLNKSDVMDDWEIDDETMADLIANGWHIVKTSAKIGTGIDDVFTDLASRILEPS